MRPPSKTYTKTEKSFEILKNFSIFKGQNIEALEIRRIFHLEKE